IEADLANVLAVDERPEAVLLRVLRDHLGAVDRTAGAELLEDRVGRTVLPVGPLGELERFELLLGEVRGAPAGQLCLGGAIHARTLLAGWPARQLTSQRTYCWIIRFQLNGPNVVSVAGLSACGSIVSFSHSSGKVLPCTTTRWKSGTV